LPIGLSTVVNWSGKTTLARGIVRAPAALSEPLNVIWVEESKSNSSSFTRMLPVSDVMAMLPGFATFCAFAVIAIATTPISAATAPTSIRVFLPIIPSSSRRSIQPPLEDDLRL
jgi:hypothetical protein